MQNLFENISGKSKEKLLRLLKASTTPYSKGVNILSNINRDNFIGIVENGSLQIIFNDYNGNRILLETLEKNDIFGNLISAINSDEVECLTMENTTITYIDYNHITDSQIEKSEIYIRFVQNLIKIMAIQLSVKNERISILTKKSIRDKLLEYFRLLSQKNSSRTFIIPFTYIDLANYLSVDRSSMSRELKCLKNEGFIKVKGKRVQLLY